MTPLEIFGAMVLRSYQEYDYGDLDGADLHEMCEKSGVTVREPYSIEKHGEYMRDEWGSEEGDEITVPAPGVSDAVAAAHRGYGR